MPEPEDLPDSLAPLARRHAIELSDERWDYDVGRLIEVLDRTIGNGAPPPPPPPPPTPPPATPVSRGRVCG